MSPPLLTGVFFCKSGTDSPYLRERDQEGARSMISTRQSQLFTRLFCFSVVSFTTPFTPDPPYLSEVAEKNHDNFVMMARVSLDIRTRYLRATDEAFQIVHSLVKFPVF
jgi:hypothetical protein